MKKIFLLFLTTFIFTAAFVFAEEDSASEVAVQDVSSESEKSDDSEKVTFDAEDIIKTMSKMPYFVFNEGLCFAQVTRFQKQDNYNRSDFRWEDYKIGAYFEAQTKNLFPFNYLARVSLFYPFYYTFNGVQQTPVQVLLYGIDIFTGLYICSENFKYIRFNLGVGPHFSYQLSDAYHHVELGGMLLAGIELPIAWRWTIIIDALGSIDYGNLGSNKVITPYDFVWQYQVSLGVRYSIRHANEYSYIPSKARILADNGIYDKPLKKQMERQLTKAEKKTERNILRGIKAEEKEKQKEEKAMKKAEERAEKEAKIVDKEIQKREEKEAAREAREREKEKNNDQGETEVYEYEVNLTTNKITEIEQPEETPSESPDSTE